MRARVLFALTALCGVAAVGYLIAALAVSGNSLADASEQLRAGVQPLQGVIHHTDPLAYEISIVNRDLNGIHTALSPVDAQLQSIDSNAVRTRDELSSVQGHAAVTEQSARAIEKRLVSINWELTSVDSSISVTEPVVTQIAQQATTLAGTLQPIEGDLGGVSGLLVQTNQHLASTCHKMPPTNGAC